MMDKKLVFKMVSGLVLLLSVMVMPAAAEEPETPGTLKDGKIISADEAKMILEQKGALFVDTRSPLNYGKGHIPGAVLLEYKNKSENKPDFDDAKDDFPLTKLPSDKGGKIVFYGHGTTGWKGYKASVKTIKAGYQNVLWLRGGTTEWEKKGFPVE